MAESLGICYSQCSFYACRLYAAGPCCHDCVSALDLLRIATGAERGGAELHAAYGADEEHAAFYDLAWTPDGTQVRPAKLR